jgi:hypothetical protein
MKLLGVVALTAALVAAQFSAQRAFAQSSSSQAAGASQREHAVSSRSDARHQTKAKRDVAGRRETKAKRDVAGVRGSRSFASAPAARYRYERGRAASSAFDGAWSVLIMTRSGACVGSYRYGVEIRNGEVLNAGGAPVDLAGHVAPNGAVRVSVSAGNQAAHGAGRLSRTSGGGTWQGYGSGGTCAGTWEAQRRT